MKGGYSMDKISRLSREIRQLEKSKKKLEGIFSFVTIFKKKKQKYRYKYNKITQARE